MDNKCRNLELEAWLIETTGEEMMTNHLGPNWNRFNEEFGFYPNMSMTIADLVWQHQQAKVEGLTYKANLRESDHQALLVKYQATKKCWEDISKEKAELQKRVGWLEDRLKATDTLSKMRAAVIGSFKTQEFNARTRRKMMILKRAEQALKGEGQ